MTANVETRAAEFVSALQAKVDAYYAANFDAKFNAQFKTTIELKAGPRYIKIIRSDVSSRAAYGFIDRNTGAILKADGWSKPAKHARGSIFADDFGLSACGPHGVAYLR